MTRLREDGLRALRAIRFKITKGFEFHDSVREALRDPEVPSLLAGTSVERRREELEKCFHHDTLATLELLANDLPFGLKEAVFSGNLRLSATQKRDFVHAQTTPKRHHD
jgi:tRNA nucleotidyltransferase/poly(A) polymerase